MNYKCLNISIIYRIDMNLGMRTRFREVKLIVLRIYKCKLMGCITLQMYKCSYFKFFNYIQFRLLTIR